MIMHISLLNKKPDWTKGHTVFLSPQGDTEFLKQFPDETRLFLSKQQMLNKTIAPINYGEITSWVAWADDQDSKEKYRVLGHQLAELAQKEKVTLLNVDAPKIDKELTVAFAEGFALSGYRFIKYFKEEDKDKKYFRVKQLDIFNDALDIEPVNYLNNLVKAVYWTRDLVNEPLNVMNATRFSQEVTIRGQESGFKVEVLDKKKIESLRMGGLLSVNKGSIDPPTFTICEWKPENAINKKPIVLVGKGVTYDTGGMSLKPTKNSMDQMKSDMAGAAAVAGAMYATALNELPVWVIALLPATDNRPDGNAYVPGDIIKMYNGLYVEVMNTDAEGRLIMADALSYGEKYNPQLVIDVATLTGNAELALGTHASALMGNADEEWFSILKKAGEETHERLVEFPFWEEYGESLKSEVADLQNLGAREGGAISAGKFLEHFTASPYMHIDIAGTSFFTSAKNYNSKGATGVGVRFLAEFFKNISNQQDKS